MDGVVKDVSGGRRGQCELAVVCGWESQEGGMLSVKTVWISPSFSAVKDFNATDFGNS